MESGAGEENSGAADEGLKTRQRIVPASFRIG